MATRQEEPGAQRQQERHEPQDGEIRRTAPAPSGPINPNTSQPYTPKELAYVQAIKPPSYTQKELDYMKAISAQRGYAQGGDMMMTDGAGVISSVLYGPDERTRLRPETRQALFTVYAPPGIAESAIARHLEDLRAAVRLF
ncbi:MAG: hypothetical protein AAB285_00195, partial [candidate division NC10 bacterium]